MLLYLVYLLTLLLMLVYLNQIWGLLSFSEWEVYNMEVSLGVSDLLFMFLVVVVSSLILFYSTYYMSGTLLMDYYLAVMFTFMVSMLLLVSSSGWVLLLLGWEGLGMTSFFLINFSGSWEGCGNAFVTLLTMRLGDYSLFFMLSGVLYSTYFNISLVSPLLCSLFLLFCMTKSAQFPFSGWLPKAMSAPTPTSALVHSSTLVTAGLVLIIKYNEGLSSGPSMTWMLVVGLLTLTSGSLMALLESSAKKVVAWSTLSQMGLGMVVCSTGSFYLGYLHLIAHGFAKSLLFMLIGYVMHLKYNQQNIKKWGDSNIEGFLNLQLLITLFSLCGVGFSGGMVVKEAVLESMISGVWFTLLISLIILSIYITFIYSVLLYKSLYMSSGRSVEYGQKSALMMVIISLEVLFVVFFFSCLMANTVSACWTFSYGEVMMPFMVLCAVFVCYYAIVNNHMYSGVVSTLLNHVNNYGQYIWLKSILDLTLTCLDKALYFVGQNSGSYVYSLSLSSKLGLIGSFNNMTLFIVLLFLFML